MILSCVLFSCNNRFYCIHNENRIEIITTTSDSCLCYVFWLSFNHSCFEWNDLQCAQNFDIPVSAMLLSSCCCHGIYNRMAHLDYFDFSDILRSRVYPFLAMWKILYLYLLDFIEGYESYRSTWPGFDDFSVTAQNFRDWFGLRSHLAFFLASPWLKTWVCEFISCLKLYSLKFIWSLLQTCF